MIPFIQITAPSRIQINISRAWARCYFRLLAAWLVVYALSTLVALVRLP